MKFMYKFVVSNVRSNFFLIFGLFLGVALSSFISEIIQNKCIFTSDSDYFSKPDHSNVLNQEDYEPVINLAGKPLKAQKTPQEFQRPRYYRTELGIRDKLLAAVLTSTKTIKDYGVAFNSTTNHLFDKVIFFMESEPNRSRNDVKMNGVVQFSDARAVLKPFHMLKYIVDNFLDDFDYFYLVRDKTYVRGRELYSLVQKISVSRIVHAGNGKSDSHSKFCSLNSGILLSNLVLQKIALKLDWCVKNAFLGSDDDNLGRCVVHSSGVGCTSSVQGLRLSTFQLNDKIKEIKFDEMDQNEAFKAAITFWPVSSPEMLLKLHLYFIEVDLKKRKSEIAVVRNEILKQPVMLPDNTTVKVSWPIGNHPPFNPVNRFDILRWDYFTEKQIYLKTDFDNINDLVGADLIDVKIVINASVKFVQENSGSNFRYKKLINGYRRFDPSRGMDYILDLAFKNSKTGEEINKRIQICKPLGKVELVPMPYVTENTRVNMLLIVDEKNRIEVLKFMESYVTVCMEKKEKTFLMLILLYGAQHPGKGSKDDIYAEVKKMALKHSDRFKRESNKIAWLSVKLPDESVVNPALFPEEKIVGLNRGILKIAVLDLVLKKFAVENLMLYCTSNMEIRQDYLNRVRMNTIRDHQIFSPIPFSEFDPDIVYSDELPRPKDLDINKNYGHYDLTDTEHISFYVKNYKEARKTIENLIPIIHMDRDLTDLVFFMKRKLGKMKYANQSSKNEKTIADPDDYIRNLTRLSINSVYRLFVKYGKLSILRGVEPGLRLRHVKQDCVGILARNDLLRAPLYKECERKRNHNSGSRSQLGHFILEYLHGCT